MSKTGWAQIATMLQHPDEMGYALHDDQGSEYWSHDGMAKAIQQQSVMDAYQEALDALLDTYGPGLCREHGMVLKSADDCLGWMTYDYGYPSGWVGDGYPDFFWFGEHANPNADPWCCIELWAHGLPGGGLVVTVPR